MAKGLEVHVAAPIRRIPVEFRHQLEAFGVQVHEFALERTGMNPLKDLMTFFSAMVFNA